MDEIAGKTGLTPKQVRKRWETGQKWLKRMLRPPGRDEDSARGRKTASIAQI
jgi:hypothetical protein